jgi:hypothetical protein
MENPNMTKQNLKLPSANARIDKRVAQYIMIRTEIEEIEERHKAELKPFKLAKERLVGEMLEFLDRTGQKSAKTAVGTVTVSVRHTAVCIDPDVFIEFVFEKNLRELIDRRANAVACRDYAQEHDGVLPPGVKINSLRTVGVTKS